MKARAAVIASLLLGSCIDTSTVLEEKPPEAGDPSERAAAAERMFAVTPRTEAGVKEAFEAMRAAAQSTAQSSPERIPRLVLAAHYALWLARHAAESDARSDNAHAALVICNTIVRDAPDRVEGYYYRAIATGMFARENTVYGPDAMSQIRSDARRAIQIDGEYDSAGPYRVLGGLYLEAPGPPSGVGSLRAALQNLETAVRLAPDHPDNALLLAKAYLDADRDGDRDRAAALLAGVPAMIDRAGDDRDRELWRRQLAELQARLEQQ